MACGWPMGVAALLDIPELNSAAASAETSNWSFILVGMLSKLTTATVELCSRLVSNS